MGLVTQELLDKLSYDMQTDDLAMATIAAGVNNGKDETSILIVFGKSDINAAIYRLCESLNPPDNVLSFSTVLVQESIQEDFEEKLRQQLKIYPFNKENSNEKFLRALETAKRLNARIISVENHEENVYKPTFVCDFHYEQLGTLSPNGIVTLHAFRTAKEAISLVKKESLNFSNASIWHENHSCAYELIIALECKNFFINCYQVPLNILKLSLSTNFVNIIMKYHYETFEHDGIQKQIVFPIGSIYSN